MTTNDSNAAAGGLRGMLDALWRIQARNQGAVLGIVIATEGSTYRKPGALVLLDEHGLRHGAISGGCLEPALEQAARDVHASGCAATVSLDTRSDEDMLFGSGIGCRGLVQVLLLPLPAQAPLARALYAAVDRGEDVRLSLATHADDLGSGAAAFSTDYATTIARWDRHGQPCDALPATALSIDIATPPRVLLLGAGPETAALAALARRLGWFVDVVEHRGRWATYAKLALVDRWIELAPEAAAAMLAGERHDAVLVMTHNYSIDLAWLRHCATHAASYVGLLGPPARRDALLADLDAPVRVQLAPRLHAPVGLDLGGEGGEAVALAIAAQLQQHFSTPQRDRARADG